MTKKEQQRRQSVADDQEKIEMEFQSWLLAANNICGGTIAQKRILFCNAFAVAIRHLQSGNYSDLKCQSASMYNYNASSEYFKEIGMEDPDYLKEAMQDLEDILSR